MQTIKARIKALPPLHLPDTLRSAWKNSVLPSVAVALLACSNVSAQSVEDLNSNRIPDSKVAYTDDEYRYDDRFRKSVYVGLGLGASWLNPDTAESSLDVNDRVNTAGQITLGTDLSKHISLELHAADLGQAGFSPTGSIDYSVFGGSALFYAGKSRHRFNRRGLTAFGRLGLGLLSNSATSNVNFEQDNETHFLIGLGLEYVLRMGLGLRAEAISFDEDIRYGQLGLTYRIGKKQNRERIQVVEAQEPTPVVAVAPPPVAAAVVEEPSVCDSLNGVLEGVNFHSNSDKLTDSARTILIGVAETLAECSDIPLMISAHTDSHGDDEYNQSLSVRRADSAMIFLAQRGVATDRIRTSAFGETQPIDTNATAAGRSRNRRVELHLLDRSQ